MLRGSLYTIYLSVLAPKICYEISIAYSAQQIINVLCFHLLFIYFTYTICTRLTNFTISVLFSYILNLTLQILQKAFCNIHESHIFFSLKKRNFRKKRYELWFSKCIAIYTLINENKKTLSKLISICLNNSHNILNLIIKISFQWIKVKNLF